MWPVALERSAFLWTEMMDSGVRTFQPLDVEPLGFRVVVPHLDQSHFRRAQTGMVSDSEDGAIARAMDDVE